MAKQRGLGKGLASLIPTEGIATPRAVVEVPPIAEITGGVAGEKSIALTSIAPNPFQPRRSMQDDMLSNLASSIKEHGVIQPILVREINEGQFQIIAGERRWRAAQIAGLDEIPARIVALSDAEAMEIALIENLQREDLTPLEVALGIQDLVNKLSLTHEEVANKIGISRAAVTNKLRLLQLPEQVLQQLENEELTEGHARALLSLPSVDKIVEFANIVIQRGLNVRQLEDLVRNAAAVARIEAALPRKIVPANEFQEEINRIQKVLPLQLKVNGSRKNMGIQIKGLKKWQVQMFLEFIENNSDELFPRE